MEERCSYTVFKKHAAGGDPNAKLTSSQFLIASAEASSRVLSFLQLLESLLTYLLNRRGDCSDDESVMGCQSSNVYYERRFT
jgi:hypothetical protein